MPNRKIGRQAKSLKHLLLFKLFLYKNMPTFTAAYSLIHKSNEGA